MEFQAKTLRLFDAVNAVLGEYEGLWTLRQVFYRLVAQQLLPNTRNAYTGLSHHLVNARREGIVDESRIVDRVRYPIRAACWTDLDQYIQTVRHSYRREKWSSQSFNVEVWCEKDAVAGTLQPITDAYEVVLFPCRGYDSYSALREAAQRVRGIDRPTVILYVGDFDPSGQDMPRDIRDRLRDDFGATFDLHLIALTREQIDQYRLPYAFTKPKDTRRAAFVERHGDMAVELDALPPNVLQDLVRENIERFFDLAAFAEERRREDEDQAELEDILDAA